MAIKWPMMSFPPINLYNAPHRAEDYEMDNATIVHKLLSRKIDKKNELEKELAYHPETQYLAALGLIVREGTWVPNTRTGIDTKVVINVDMTYDVGNGAFPLVTTRKMGIKTAVGELLGYLRGYTNAEDFAALGAKSWYMNANETQAWLNNPHRKGENDCGQIYGAIARNWPKHDGTTIDTLKKIVNNLKAGIDDRGEILTFWNPGMFELGALRPCMYEHQFSLVDGVLHLNSTQRSADWPIGTASNMVQCYVLLALMARITGHKPGMVQHRSVNAHIYDLEDTMEKIDIQLGRTPFETPTLVINPNIKSLDDLLTWVTVDDFKVENYQSHPPITYPFAS